MYFVQEIQQQILKEFKITMTNNSQHQEKKKRYEQLFGTESMANYLSAALIDASIHITHGYRKYYVIQYLFSFPFHIGNRFDYLHHKLSHIKRLVHDFDSTITKGQTHY